MKRFALALILLCVSLCGADEYLGSWKIDDYITITVTTHQFSTGAAYAATGNVLLDIYEDATSTEIVDDTTMSNFDGRTGLYQARVQLTAVAGFEKGKHYTCVVAATVDGVAALWAANFQIEAEVDSNVNSGSVTLGSGALDSTALDTTAIAEIFNTSLNTYNDKHSAAWWWKHSKQAEPIPVEIGETAQDGGTANTIVLAATSVDRDDAYRNMLVQLIDGTGAPATRTIVSYVGSTTTATVNEDWPGDSPDSGTTYTLIGAAASELAHEGLAQAGDATTITLAADAPAIDDIEGWIILKSGTGAPDTQEIVSYVGSTKVLTVTGWGGDSPSTDTYYALIPFGDTVSDTPAPVGLTLEELQWAIDQRADTTDGLIGEPNEASIAADLAILEAMVDSLEAKIGDPNNTDIASDVRALEVVIETILGDGGYGLEAIFDEISSVAGSYDVDALWELCWDIYMNLP